MEIWENGPFLVLGISADVVKSPFKSFFGKMEHFFKFRGGVDKSRIYPLVLTVAFRSFGRILSCGTRRSRRSRGCPPGRGSIGRCPGLQEISIHFNWENIWKKLAARLSLPSSSAFSPSFFPRKGSAISSQNAQAEGDDHDDDHP